MGKKAKEGYAKEHKILARNLRIVNLRVARERNVQVSFYSKINSILPKKLIK